MRELKTIRFPGDAEPRVVVDGAAIHFDKPQGLTPEKQSQARANIGVGDEYYCTAREKMGVASVFEINEEYVRGLYDALMADYPDRMRKYEIHNHDGTFTNYAYEISTGDYSTTGSFCVNPDNDPDSRIKKPKYLISSCMHGNEAINTLYLYRFVRDVLSGRNVPNSFREGAILHILPAITPCGLGGTIPLNDNGVNISMNFNWRWDERTSDVNGTAPESEKETQAVVNWLKANTDADLWIDLHNSSLGNEPVAVVGCAGDRIDTAKRVILRGINKVIPFWKEVIGYPEYAVVREWMMENGNYVWDAEKGKWKTQDVPKALIYSYSATLPGLGCNYTYAPNVLGIPTVVLEIAGLNGDFTDAWLTTRPVTAENVAMGTEILGNALIEFFNVTIASEVVDMTQTNEKIDALSTSIAGDMEQTHGKLDALSASMTGDMSAIHAKLDLLLGGTEEPAEPTNGFRVESGVYTAETDSSGATQMNIPCSPGAKIFAFVPDDETQSRVAALNTQPVFLGYIGQRVAKLTAALNNTLPPAYRGHGTIIRSTCVQTDCPSHDTLAVFDAYDGGGDNTNGFQFTAIGLKSGTYNWTAYYWNEPEEA